MGRHALLEATDVPAVSPLAPLSAGRVGATASEVRTVAQIIAQFRADEGLPTPGPGVTPELLEGLAPTAEPAVPAAPGLRLVEPVTAVDDEHDDDDQDHHRDHDDTDRDDDPTTGRRVETEADREARSRREAAWQAALRPAGEAPRRRRAPRGGGASAVIASLTAELAATNPGLLEGSPHRRRAEPAAKRVAPAGSAPSLRPIRVSGGLRGAALRAPALTAGWRVPARTPLVLAGVVALSVVVTDQTGLLAATAGAVGAAGATEKPTADTTVADTQAAAASAAASQGAREAQTRVSRLERSPIAAADPATVTGATPAGGGTAIAPAPPPDSVMKPGQTIAGDFVRPSPSGVYNSCFCSRWGTFHEGIDFAAPLGSPILAAASGVVVDAGPASGFGNWVVIRTDDGDINVYGHMRYYYVKAGDRIAAGQEIALVGAEGQSTGAHLHFGVKVGSTNGVDGTYVDPVPWLVARGVDVGTYNQNG